MEITLEQKENAKDTSGIAYGTGSLGMDCSSDDAEDAYQAHLDTLKLG